MEVGEKRQRRGNGVGEGVVGDGEVLEVLEEFDVGGKGFGEVQVGDVERYDDVVRVIGGVGNVGLCVVVSGGDLGG